MIKTRLDWLSAGIHSRSNSFFSLLCDMNLSFFSPLSNNRRRDAFLSCQPNPSDTQRTNLREKAQLECHVLLHTPFILYSLNYKTYWIEMVLLAENSGKSHRTSLSNKLEPINQEIFILTVVMKPEKTDRKKITDWVGSLEATVESKFMCWNTFDFHCCINFTNKQYSVV